MCSEPIPASNEPGGPLRERPTQLVGQLGAAEGKLEPVAIEAAVVFDMDGVLVDSESINRLAFDDYLTGLDVRPSDEFFAFILGRRFVDFVDELAATLERAGADDLSSPLRL